MSRTPAPSGSGWVRSTVIPGLVSALHEMRTRVGGLTNMAAARAKVGAEDGQPRARETFVAPDCDHVAPPEDGVAGSEFLDDHIRLRE